MDLKGPKRSSRLPRWLSDKESTCQCKRCRRLRFDLWVRKIPWRRKWQPTPEFLPGESHGQRSLGGLQFMGSQRVGRDLLTEHVRRHHLVQPFHLTYRAKTGASDPESTVFVAEPMVAL